jgi:hypothetical protein
MKHWQRRRTRHSKISAAATISITMQSNKHHFVQQQWRST